MGEYTENQAAEDPAYEDDEAYEAAQELAESYTSLLKQKESYRGKLGKYPHYTIDDAYYLLTQGAHEQMERVQTSGTSDSVARAVTSAEKLMRRLNAEMDAEYQKEVVEPYMDICERVHLFEVCMNVLGRRQYHIADQLYVQNVPKKDIVDLQGRPITRRTLAKDIHGIISKFAWVLSQYRDYRKSGGDRMVKED